MRAPYDNWLVLLVRSTSCCYLAWHGMTCCFLCEKQKPRRKDQKHVFIRKKKKKRQKITQIVSSCLQRMEIHTHTHLTHIIHIHILVHHIMSCWQQTKVEEEINRYLVFFLSRVCVEVGRPYRRHHNDDNELYRYR